MNTTLLGDALTTAQATAAAAGTELELAQGDTRLALCAVVCHREIHTVGKLTVDAAIIRQNRDDEPRHNHPGPRSHGYIVLGPLATRRPDDSMNTMLRYTQVRRWVMYRAVTGRADGTREHSPNNIIYARPSLVLEPRVRLTCSECGYSFDEWKNTADIRQREAGSGAIPCASRQSCTGTMYIERLRSVLTNPGDRYRSGCDVIVDDAALLQDLFNAWRAGVPSTGATIVLPRIFCVYPKIGVPDRLWRPSDARAQSIADAAEAYTEPARIGEQWLNKSFPLGILPFGLARQFHMPPEPINRALAGIWLDAPERMIGWIQLKDLYDFADLGYKRKLWYDIDEKPEINPTV